MSWIIYALAVVGFLSLVGTAGVLFAAWACHTETDEDELLREQQAEPIPGWLLGLVVLALLICAWTLGLISYFLVTR